MGRRLFVKNTPIPTFYRRRISRILPAHVAFVVIVAGVCLGLGRPFSCPETLAALLFVNNYVGSEPGQGVMPFGHIWSLSVEEHSYVLLSILALAARRFRVPSSWLVGACVFASATFGIWYSLTFSGRELVFGR